jgi:hypothetical protein
MVKHRYGRGQQGQQQGQGSGEGGAAASPGPSGGGEEAPGTGRALGWREHLALELQHRGGYLPLMDLFPLDCASIPWRPEDQQLRKEWPQLWQGC